MSSSASRPIGSVGPLRSPAARETPRGSLAAGGGSSDPTRRRPPLVAAPRRRSPPPRGRSSAGAARSSGGSPPGCGRGGRCTAASASSDATRSSSVSPIPTRIPLVNGIRSSPGRLDRLQPPRRVLGRRAGVDRLHQPLGDRLEHQPLRGGDLAQPRQVLARSRTPRFVCGSSPRSSARSQAQTT